MRVLKKFLAHSKLRKVGYLTHMFVVFAAFHFFLAAGKPTRSIPFLFLAVIVVSAVLGQIVSLFYSEPLNNLIRSHWRHALDQ